jgi:hypothetical protein
MYIRRPSYGTRYTATHLFLASYLEVVTLAVDVEAVGHLSVSNPVSTTSAHIYILRSWHVLVG